MSDKIILYHGSFCIVQNPDLSRCAAGKDFGQGFYLTTSKAQAQKFVATSIKKAFTQKVLTQSQMVQVLKLKKHIKTGKINMA